jgi:hypothetical protein
LVASPVADALAVVFGFVLCAASPDGGPLAAEPSVEEAFKVGRSGSSLPEELFPGCDGCALPADVCALSLSASPLRCSVGRSELPPEAVCCVPDPLLAGFDAEPEDEDPEAELSEESGERFSVGRPPALGFEVVVLEPDEFPA